MIVGVSGLYGAGKGEVVAFFRARGFAAYSLSDVVREELTRLGLPETRERMIETGSRLRSEEGVAALARRLSSRLQPDRNYVIDSVRHPAEIALLREREDEFLLLWVEAPESIRLERILRRERPGDPTSLDELRQLESREMGSERPDAQQLGAVRDAADVTIVNDTTIEELHRKLEGVLKENLFFARPSWDDYFMRIARVVATRSNCVKRKVAAVLTVDRRVIATGYNGTPRGVRNCNEGGCPRCLAFGPGGVDLGECLCSHAEENAITQSAYHGVGVRGAVLYSTYCPCLMCTKMIINAGIAEVVYCADYPMGETSVSLLREGGVRVRRI